MKSPRNLKDVSWLFFLCVGLSGALLLAFNLRPSSFSGTTGQEVAQKAREATLQEVEQSTITVGDPDTTQDQINARWQEIGGTHDAPIGVVECARKSCAARTWPVELRTGNVNGTTVWVAVCGWPSPPTHIVCVDYGCDSFNKDIAMSHNTEVVVISDEETPHLLAHIGREPLQR